VSTAVATKDEKQLEKILKRFKEAEDADGHIRTAWLEDMRFTHVPGAQWPDDIRNARENQQSPRPCLEINTMAQHVYQVLNDIRENRPSIKCRPVSMNASNDVAEVYDGVIRHIEACSDGEIAVDVAAQGQVTGGLGYLRLVTDYVDRERNEQEIYIKAVYNPLAVYLDPNAMCPVGSDAKWGFYVEDMVREEFEEEYGKDIEEWTAGQSTANPTWNNKTTVRVAEYFAKSTKETNVLVLIDGTEMSEADYWEEYAAIADRPQVISNRTDSESYVKWQKITASKILEEADFPSEWIPLIRVPGVVIDIEGKRYYKGLTRDSKDSQRSVNYFWSTFTETVAIQPKVPWIVAEGQIEGYEHQWDKANTANLPYLTYKQTDFGGQPAPPPARSQLQMAPQGIMQGLQMAGEFVKSSTGQFNASLGERSNETSGKAIVARDKQGNTATYHFPNNLALAVKHMGRIMIGMIPKVYDTPRVMRILGEDGETEEARIDPNQAEPVREAEGPDGAVHKIYNLGVGKYDVIATIGPTYSTKRQEAVDAMAQIMQSNANVFPLIGDIWVRNQDWPGADAISDRLKIMLPPQIQQAESKQGGKMPPQAQAALQGMQQQMQQMKQQADQVIQQLTQQLQAAKSGEQVKLAQLQQKNQADMQRLGMEQQTEQQRMGMNQQTEAQRMNVELYKADLQARTAERIAAIKAQADAQIKLELGQLDAVVQADRNAAEMARTHEMAQQPPFFPGR
jgi:hypothetical protein